MPASDSEADEDYVPPNEAESSSSSNEDEPDSKRARTSSSKPEEEPEVKQRARGELWKEFQASIASKSSTPKLEAQKKMVKVEKRHLFAGKEVVEIVEVPEDSPDAKRWPLWSPPEETSQTASISHSSVPQDVPPQTETTTTATTSSDSTPKAPIKRPGPRRGKMKLGEIPSSSQKAKKITTLEKSAMDWRAHVTSEGVAEMKDELEANRRGGGYLEKVEFLERVNERREGVLDANKSGKRRRG